eukprot:5211838-Amphidinium_carterae.1
MMKEVRHASDLVPCEHSNVKSHRATQAGGSCSGVPGALALTIIMCSLAITLPQVWQRMHPVLGKALVYFFLPVKLVDLFLLVA